MMIEFLLNPSDDIIFTDIQKSKNDTIVNALKIASYLEKNSIFELEVFLEDSYEFVCVLLASLLVKAKITLLDSQLNTSETFCINKDNFKKLLKEESFIKAKILDEKSTIFFKTSGSSGKSKKIEKTLKQIISEANHLISFFAFSKDNIFLSSVSFQHNFGFIFKIAIPLLLNAKIISKQLKYPENVLSQDLKNAVLISSPALLKRVVKYKNVSKLKALSRIITAGSALPYSIRLELEEKIENKIINIYGSTESGVIAYSDKDIFYPFANISQNKNGGIDIKSPWCEYFHSKDEIEFVENKGFNLLGRIDRIIKLEDKRVSLINIEEFMLNCDYIKDCFIDKHPKYNRLLALIVLSDEGIKKFKQEGKKGLVLKLKQHLKQRYDSVSLVRYFKILESLPTNAQGKITKNAFLNSLKDKKELLWQEIEREQNRATFKAISSVELYCFSEHFPSLPLLPGFMQLKFIYQLAEKMGIKFEPQHCIENVKFLSFSHPNDELKVSLELKRKKLYFEIFTNDNLCAKGRMLIE